MYSGCFACEGLCYEKSNGYSGKCRLFLPAPVRCAVTVLKSVKYMRRGLQSVYKRKIEVSLLDAVAIGTSVARGDIGTAASVI